jgi:hypothetical protein
MKIYALICSSQHIQALGRSVLTSSLRLAKTILVRLRRDFDKLHQIAKSDPDAHIYFLVAGLSQRMCSREGRTWKLKYDAYEI